MSYVVDRFLAYCKIASQSDPEHADVVPSTPEQFNMARAVYEDLLALGAKDVSIDEHAYVLAKWPASTGYEDVPALGFCCHIDTAFQAEGKVVNPRIVRYEGGTFLIGHDKSGKKVAISEDTNPELKTMQGKDLVVADGTSILGGDDKAGIAELIAMLKRFKEDPSLIHPEICLAFVPDEEISHGAKLLDIEKFGAKLGYTLDAGPIGEFCYETFNACEVRVYAQGRSVHTGTAKNIMINAGEALMKFNELLPSFERPEHTEGYEGFYYLETVNANCVEGKSSYIIRDHDAKKFEARKRYMETAKELINQQYAEEVISLEFIEQYRNMSEVITLPENVCLIDFARGAYSDLGYEMKSIPMRGGTDGSQLSFRGFACANMSCGYYNAHGYMEFVPVYELEDMVEVLLALCARFVKHNFS